MVGSNVEHTWFKANEVQHTCTTEFDSEPFETNDVFWLVSSQSLDELRVSQHMLSSSLAAPNQDLLRPRAQWRPQLWAQWWILCCSYMEAWCCCHCRRILSGKVGTEICAKTRQQATLHGWTDIWMQVRQLLKTKTVDSCINRHYQQEDSRKAHKGTDRLKS